ncbi:TetR family transcriptional regulator [Shinella sp. CPCC 101442]|uniref:TetR family transcriptional regulator n=1 Tax=Shinella sp. CPCC 101442 TaxID=2932265 RepID=UPI002152CD3B|nr:TetR family transcriptional regulator [Shinella sp. CPCC 101442]MCR6499904.1 TetR family transcriptional regulator [Shinella sp. CPCC 101442]
MRRTKAEAKETRQQILLAAEKVFYEKGVAHASMEDVARVAGVTRGAIYWHFANRADLVLELYNSLPMPQEELIARELEAENADVFGVLERVGREWLEMLATDEHRQRILSILLRCDTSGEFAAISERQNDLDDEHMQALEAAFAKAEGQGKLGGTWTPRSAASMLRWVIKGLCSEWLLFGRRFDIASEGKEALRRLFATYSAPTPST